MSLLNFVTISFYLLIDNLTAVPDRSRFRDYVFIFLILYIPLAILVGFFDMINGTYQVEQKMAMEMSPIWNELFVKLNSLNTKQNSLLELIMDRKSHDQ